MREAPIKELLKNKRNTRLYEIHTKYECGLSLESDTVKEILNYKLSLGGSYGWIKNNEIWLRGFKENKGIKLLLNREEINKIIKYVKEKKYLLIPENMYLKNRKIKLTLLIAKRNKHTNKTKLESIKKKDEKKMLKYE